MDDREIKKRFGQRLRALRLARGLSQEGLGGKASLDRTYVSSCEAGRRNVSLVNVVRLAEALGVSPAEFFPANESTEQTPPAQPARN